MSPRVLLAKAGLVLAGALGGSAVALAAPPAIPFIGEALLSDEVPFDGQADFAVRVHAHPTDEAALWPPAGEGPAVWAEYLDVAVQGGVFTLVLGDDAAPLTSDLLPADGAWLELSINGEIASPRLAMLSVPYALRAADAARVGGLEPSELALLSDLPDLSGYATLGALSAVATSGLYADLLGLPDLSGFVQAGALAAVAFSGSYADLTDPPTLGATVGAAPPGDPEPGALWYEPLTETLRVFSGSWLDVSGAITSIDGLEGGAVDGDTQVVGTLSADVIVQGGQQVCDVSGNCGPTLADLECDQAQVAFFADGQWQCADLTTPQQLCDGPNEALQWDGSAYTCRQIVTAVASQGNAKGYEILDSWGHTWDGLERAPSTWNDARQSCLDLGGRLPTASELYRVSAVVADEVGTVANTQHLWTLTPWTRANYTTVRLDTGATTGATPASLRRYRCIWANYPADAFAGNHCNGPADEPCWTVTTHGGARYHLDRWDRPELRYVGAIHDCFFHGAHVVEQLDMVTQITDGLPGGQVAWMFVADPVARDFVNLVRWDDVQLDFSDFGSAFTARSERFSQRRVRCIGRSTPQEVNPNPVPSAHTGTQIKLRGELTDRPVARWWEAVSACYESGGHLPTDRDVNELVWGGWPGDVANAYRWTASATSEANVMTLRWQGVPINYGYDASERNNVSRSSSPGFGYRCVYYPLDPEAQPLSCNFGCFTTQHGSVAPRIMWADNVDRVPAPYIEAVKTCQSAGGRLATLRDVTELVRAGLGSGSAAWLWTSEQANNSDSTGNFVTQVRWTGVDADFTGTTSTYVRRVSKTPSNAFAYRCVFSNELP